MSKIPSYIFQLQHYVCSCVGSQRGMRDHIAIAPCSASPVLHPMGGCNGTTRKSTGIWPQYARCWLQTSRQNKRNLRTTDGYSNRIGQAAPQPCNAMQHWANGRGWLGCNRFANLRRRRSGDLKPFFSMGAYKSKPRILKLHSYTSVKENPT